MNEIKFITGNGNKLEEAIGVLGNVEAIDVDLDEIQQMDPKMVIEAKLKEARKYYDGKLFCEDTSLYIDSMNGFPGPLVKWYLSALGGEGVYRQVSLFENRKAVAKTVIGYYDGCDVKFFEGEVEGEIVSPVGDRGFGWDSIFMPSGCKKTFAQMSVDEKSCFSMRKMALEKFRGYLSSSGK